MGQRISLAAAEVWLEDKTVRATDLVWAAVKATRCKTAVILLSVGQVIGRIRGVQRVTHRTTSPRFKNDLVETALQGTATSETRWASGLGSAVGMARGKRVRDGSSAPNEEADERLAARASVVILAVPNRVYCTAIVCTDVAHFVACQRAVASGLDLRDSTGPDLAPSAKG